MDIRDPTCKDKQATDDNYNAGLAFVVGLISIVWNCLAVQYNEYSNLYLAELMAKRGYNQTIHVSFAQLYGMSDNISFNLANAGYCAAKYVPYAPVKKCCSYLIRRAEENTLWPDRLVENFG